MVFEFVVYFSVFIELFLLNVSLFIAIIDDENLLDCLW